MRALFFIVLFLFSTSVLAGERFHTSGSTANMCSYYFSQNKVSPYSSTGCGSNNKTYKVCIHNDNGTVYNSSSCASYATTIEEWVHTWVSSCPSGTAVIPGAPYGECSQAPPTPETGDTATGQCRAWSPECNDSTIVDSNGDVWTNDGLGICDMDICLNQYTKTDSVDPNDPTTWPEGSIASDDFNAPTLPGTSEDSPFDNWTQGFPAAVDTEVDTQTSSSSDGSTSTTTKTTELGVDESGPFKTETTQTTSTDSSGNTTTTTTTKTTDSSGNVSTSTTSSTTDSGGIVTGSSSSSSVDQGGEEEADGARVSGMGSCSNRPVCEGDPVGCAVLLQNWLQTCSQTEFVEPTFETDIEAQITALEQEFQTVFNSIQSDIQNEIGLTLSGGGTIVPNIFNLWGVEVDFSWARWVQYLQIIGILILAAAWLSALFILLTGSG